MTVTVHSRREHFFYSYHILQEARVVARVGRIMRQIRVVKDAIGLTDIYLFDSANLKSKHSSVNYNNPTPTRLSDPASFGKVDRNASDPRES